MNILFCATLLRKQLFYCAPRLLRTSGKEEPPEADQEGESTGDEHKEEASDKAGEEGDKKEDEADKTDGQEKAEQEKKEADQKDDKTDGTSESGDSKSDKKEAEAKEKTPKVINIKETIKAVPERLDVKDLSEERFKTSKKRLADLRKADQAKVELEKARNEQETYIFDLQDKLSGGPFEKCSTEKERENLNTLLSETSQWFYNSSDDAKKSNYRPKAKPKEDKKKEESTAKSEDNKASPKPDGSQTDNSGKDQQGTKEKPDDF